MISMKNTPNKKVKPPQEIPEEVSLEKEIEDLIDREKTKNRIVSKLLNQTIPPSKKLNH